MKVKMWTTKKLQVTYRKDNKKAYLIKWTEDSRQVREDNENFEELEQELFNKGFVKDFENVIDTHWNFDPDLGKYDLRF